MPVEIERKFLVKTDQWRKAATTVFCRQGYLNDGPHAVIRVRRIGETANINIKEYTLSISRLEYEYPIPCHDADDLLDRLCMRPIIEKKRHFLNDNGHAWIIDEFEGDNAGLIVAEIELEDEFEAFALPPWADREVSDDPRYLNINLVNHPYKNWG